MNYFTCETCSAVFASKVERQFCSVKCRARSPRFREQIFANLAKACAAYVPVPRQGETRPCAQCATPMYLTQTMIKRGARTCSRKCYRALQASRFDRHIGAEQHIDRMSNFDEFLSQPELTCLMPDCAWQGHNLSLHLNLSHGITEDVAKARAGFNKHTALVSPAMAGNLQKRGNTGHTKSLESSRPNRAGQQQETRGEALEHSQKAAALRHLQRLFEAESTTRHV